MSPAERSATKRALLSESAVEAYRLAAYRLRHNARYSGWPEDKRIRHMLAAAFDAAASPTPEPVP